MPPVPAAPGAVDAAVAAPPPPDLSALGLFMHADGVGKAVIIILAIASLACWAVIIEKIMTLVALNRQVKILAEAGEATGMGIPQDDGMAARVLRAGAREWHEGREPGEGRSEYRDRLERAMRSAMAKTLRKAARGLPILATTGAVAPFIGLFGTVWGIMRSFTGIAQSGDTSLAVVAPGIAEALFATAIGLAAAIPAVIAYNRLTLGIGRTREEGGSVIAELANGMARRSMLTGRAGASRAAE
ncbi:MotA/TolQ/ExbB proton channel family protein [Acetobacteraceae bacterium H6797]|nr:MotA/TolQ/ExbB proton channel family protein [Acetobacteraceae bacterium H6797]